MPGSSLVYVGAAFAALPLWLQTQLQTMWASAGLSVVTSTGPRAFNFPVTLQTYEDTPSVLGLSNLRVNKLAHKNAVAPLVLEVDAGTLDAP